MEMQASCSATARWRTVSRSSPTTRPFLQTVVDFSMQGRTMPFEHVAAAGEVGVTLCFSSDSVSSWHWFSSRSS
eukprot:7380704-Prymnesium_polylepis.1